MKKIFIFTILTLAFAHQAMAFNVRAFVQVNRFSASASVFNSFGRPIMCNIRAIGTTYYGQTVYSYADRVIVYPGMTGYAYVYARPGNPFVSANGNAQCFWY